MGLGFNGHYIQQCHNFSNELHCMYLMIVVKLVVTCINKNIKLCLFDEHVFWYTFTRQYIIQMLSKHLNLRVAALLSFRVSE